MEKSILMVGVGGQGTILVTKILSYGLLEKGYEVKTSEIHGMAQRGGSVTTQIRYGDHIHSPCVDDGSADTLIAFEVLEAARYIRKLKVDGQLIVNNSKIYPMPVLSGYAQYPENIMEQLQEEIQDITLIDAVSIAEKAGGIRSQNIVMLGILVKKMDLGEIDWIGIIKRTLPKRFHELNCKAFQLGYEYVP